MRMKNLNNTAFSLLEILFASIIFVVSVAGVFATLNAVRTPVANKESALTATVFGKQVLETLRAQVTDPQGSLALYYNCSVGSSPCPDFSLSVGTHQVNNTTLISNGLVWPTEPSGVNLGSKQSPVNDLNYTVFCADGIPADCTTNTDTAHKVDLSINY